ncbi:hypothetical protein ACPVPU_08730 [Sphingomonas sp. CJ99]
MFQRLARLFTIKTKFEAFMVIFGLANGAADRGTHYLVQYPGWLGWFMFCLCPIAVFMAATRILDSVERAQAEG